MKRILFFIESLSGGGAEKVLVTLLRNLDSEKYKITLLTFVDTGNLREEIDHGRVEYKTFIRPTSTSLGSVWNKVKYILVYNILPPSIACRWVIPQRDYDVYVAFTEGFSTKLLADLAGQKTVAWVHIDLIHFPWTRTKHIYRSLEEEKIVYCKYNRVICVSPSVEKVMKEYYGLINTQLILNPIDTEHILSEALLENSATVRKKGLLLVAVGRLVEQKGFDILIPMVRKLKDRGIPAYLYILGEGPQRHILEEIIHDNDLSDYVSLPGFVKNPYSIMKQQDIFVCPSRAEGYNLAMAEALVLGVPVISMNCAGPDFLLENGRYGVLCDNYDEFFQSLLHAALDNDYRLSLKEKALSRRNTFNLQETLSEVENLLDSLS